MKSELYLAYAGFFVKGKKKFHPRACIDDIVLVKRLRTAITCRATVRIGLVQWIRHDMRQRHTIDAADRQ